MISLMFSARTLSNKFHLDGVISACPGGVAGMLRFVCVAIEQLKEMGGKKIHFEVFLYCKKK